ncbi:MAG TPA: ATP synthase F1 subunit gamma [Nitrospinae bacterium]|nr:ATP synthase F1 subunit gamma [Nitrospinota bacterium]
MPSTRDFKNRIRSVKNTQQITRAMKLVAASKVRRAQERIESARPYSQKMEELVNSLAQRVEGEPHPLLRDTMKSDKALLLVISSDKGLCGSYNTNVNRFALQFLRSREEEGKETELVVVGRKACTFLGHREYTFKEDFQEVYGKIDFQLAQAISDILMKAFLEEGFDEIHIITTEFITLLNQMAGINRLLPLAPAAPDGVDPQGDPVSVDYLYEPSMEGVLASILPCHITVQVYRALLDAEASEFGSRMTAMDNATRNAEDMIDTLTLQMNRARQAAITKELLEVIAGADALSG